MISDGLLEPETISARFRPSVFAKDECSSRVTAIVVLGVGGVYPLAGSGSPLPHSRR
jgi:hypothetical protein